MDDRDPEQPETGTPGRAYPRFYLPIVFWLGLALLVVGLAVQEGPAILGGALLMAWGLVVGALGHWAQRARARARDRRRP